MNDDRNPRNSKLSVKRVARVDSPDLDGLERHLHLPEAQQWLMALHETTPPIPNHAISRGNGRDMLTRAADCYSRAQWHADAGRVFQSTGSFEQAARQFEKLGRWNEAAEGYRRSENWPRAAECYLRQNDFASAAECWVRTGAILEAAWLWADGTQDFPRSRSLVERFEAVGQADQFRCSIVLARCDTGQREPSAALSHFATLLRLLNSIHKRPSATARNINLDTVEVSLESIPWIFSLEPVWRQRAFALTRLMHRPDLGAQLHAITLVAGQPSAEQDWNRWSIELFGQCELTLTTPPTIPQSQPPTQ